MDEGKDETSKGRRRVESGEKREKRACWRGRELAEDLLGIGADKYVVLLQVV